MTNLTQNTKDRALFRLLDTNGDGTGSKSAAVDGSSTPVILKFQPEPGTVWGISSLHGIIADNAPSTSWTAENYGGIPTLANGVQVGVYRKNDEAVVKNMLDSFTIRSNAGWGLVAYDTMVQDFGSGDNFFSFNWRIAEDLFYHPIYVGEDEFFGVQINDDLTGLTEHVFNVRGWRFI